MSSKLQSAALSMRSGAMVLRSVSLFLARSSSTSKKTSTTGEKPASTRRHNRHHQCTAGETAAGGGDGTLDSSGRRRLTAARKRMSDKDGHQKLSQRVLEMVKRDTHFNRSEIEALYKVYRKLISMNRPKPNQDKTSNSAASGGAASIKRKPNTIGEGIDRTVFCELLHITFDIVTEDMLMERIFCVWDRENANRITAFSWFAGLSIFLRGTAQERIEFCFAVYDLNVDGYITKEEMFQLLKNCLIKHPQEEDPEEGVKDFVEIVMRKLDKDRDGKVSLQDYRESVTEEPLLLEAFGKCLPAERARDTFLSTMKV